MPATLPNAKCGNLAVPPATGYIPPSSAWTSARMITATPPMTQPKMAAVPAACAAKSRFSKLGGEMVPHLKIEETIQKIIGSGEDELKVAVTAVPDERKGERLVVLHSALPKTPDQICKELSQAGLPNLWIPSPDSFCQVEEIPVLGTGKVDLKGLQTLAMEKFGNTRNR